MKKGLTFETNNNTLHILLSGDIVGYDNETLKSDIYELVRKQQIKSIIINASNLAKWDSTLVAFIFELETISRGQDITSQHIDFPSGLERLIKLAFSVDRHPAQPGDNHADLLDSVGIWGINVYESTKKGLTFLTKAGGGIVRLIFGTSDMRGTDLSFALEECTYKALPIVSLISFMVGLILAFVGAVQLKTFGAQIYVASLVTIGMTRIMGAIMTGIIMAGRTGASYAATIGTMQVNEEVDALKTMGVNPMDFLVSPRMIALTISMPILTILADFMGMIGGGFVGVTMLGIPLQKYWDVSIAAISLNNFLVGIFHGLVFGIVTAICGCYYGIYCGRNADSVGSATTKAVVASIIWMIVMTGLITVVCEVLDI